MAEIFPIATVLLLLLLTILSVVSFIRASRRASSNRLESLIAGLNEGIERLERALREEFGRNREESGAGGRQLREEVTASVKSSGETIAARIADMATLQSTQLETFGNQLTNLTNSLQQRLEAVRETVEQRLKMLQDENSQKLEQMRETVDEKLHATLELRLGESFKLVSERLEQVYQGLGEMQTLASGVGDLKKVLTNIKTRGTWGEIQLGALLEQVLAKEQYAKNVATRPGGSERVDYAIRLPGREAGDGSVVWLPIDAKFPQEDFQRLLDAQEEADTSAVEEAGRQLENRIKGEAKTIGEKYLDPPHTTDFGIMFLPTEGLYAEVTRRIGLCEHLQREYRVTIAGPNTLVAFLNSLQMGFRTLAIERRSSEVWALLGAVKTEFGRFGEILDKTKKKLDEASNTIDGAATRSRAIERKLRDVQQLPASDAAQLLGESEGGGAGER
ncbi:MAG: DNA recombination protein RmuC [Bacteroidota bacterium]